MKLRGKLHDKMAKSWLAREDARPKVDHWGASVPPPGTPIHFSSPHTPPVAPSISGYASTTGGTISGTWSTSGTTSAPFITPTPIISGSTVFSGGFGWTPLATAYNDPRFLMIRVEEAIERYMRGDQDGSDHVMVSRADWIVISDAVQHLYRDGWRRPAGGFMTYSRWGFIFGFLFNDNWPDSMPVLVHRA